MYLWTKEKLRPCKNSSHVHPTNRFIQGEEKEFSCKKVIFALDSFVFILCEDRGDWAICAVQIKINSKVHEFYGTF